MEEGRAQRIMSIENIPSQMFLEIFSRLPIKSLCIVRCVCKQWYNLTLHSMMLLKIFSRLPIRSLCRVRCVCKQWYHLTRDPSFHNMLLARPTSIEEEPLILTSTFDFYQSGEEEEDVDSTTYVRWMTEGSTPPKTLFALPGNCSIYHSLDGLLCIVTDFGTVMVSNPLTAEHLTLPSLTASVGIFGLGFDSSIEKYKIVGVYFNHKIRRRCAQVYVIGAGSSSSWREIKSRPTSNLDKFQKSIYASGARHWLVNAATSSPKPWDTLFISFNFEKEEFKTLPRPAHFCDGNPGWLELVDLGGDLGVVVTDIAHRYMQIWKLKDYERNWWVREYRIPKATGFVQNDIVGLTREDVFWLMTCVKDGKEDDYDREEDVYHQLVAYNCKTTSWRNIYEFEDTDQIDSIRGGLGVFLHRGSLVSLS